MIDDGDFGDEELDFSLDDDDFDFDDTGFGEDEKEEEFGSSGFEDDFDSFGNDEEEGGKHEKYDEDEEYGKGDLPVSVSSHKGKLANLESSKKTAIVAVIAGVLTLVVGLLIYNAMHNNSNSSVNTSNAKDGAVESKKVEDVPKNEHQVNIVSEEVNTSKWIEVEPDDSIDFKEISNSSFTVTSIKHLADASSLEEKQVISELTGSISGLNGTYILQVPYDKGIKLELGNVFNISYKIGDKNDYRVICDIRY